MHIAKTQVHGNANVGLFGSAFQGKLLFGEKLRTKDKELFEKILQAKYERISLAGTSLIGIMSVHNTKTLLIPSLTLEQEREALDTLGITYEVFDTEVTCLGNTIVCNEHGAIISTEFSEQEAQKLTNLLQVPCVQTDIAGLTTPGAVIVINGANGIIHRDASDTEVALVEKTLNVTLEPATVNLGSPHLHAGILRSETGLLVGDQSGGPEIMHIDESLGYHTLK